MSKWIPSWRYVAMDFNWEIGCLENNTQRSVHLNNVNGEAVRVRLENRFNPDVLTITHACIALRNRRTGVLSTAYPITLSGEETMKIPADSAPYSDEIPVDVTWEDDFVVSMYFGEKTPVRTVCQTFAGVSWQSFLSTGDYAGAAPLGFAMKKKLMPGLANDPHENMFTVGLSEIAVKAPEETKLVALFGDSITHMGFFSDSVVTALYEKHPGKLAVINCGISGNRIARTFPAAKMPGGGHQFGIAGKDRLLRDAYSGALPDIVFIMEGVNDCSHSLAFEEDTVPAPADIFAGLEETIQLAKQQGSRVYVTTVTPFGAFFAPWRPAAEEIRWGYNDLIRKKNTADDWVDLDAIMRDPADPHRIQEGMHLGDYVHPGWPGGKKMAKAIVDKWF